MYRVSHQRHKNPFLADTESNTALNNFYKEFLPDSTREYRFVSLCPLTYYEFEVEAKTNLGWGYASNGIAFTTIPREAPKPPSNLKISQVEDRKITFSWNPGELKFFHLYHY